MIPHVALKAEESGPSITARRFHTLQEASDAEHIAARRPSAPPISLPVACPTIPPLPLTARQPSLALACLPTCSAALPSALTNWQARLTAPDSPASAVSLPTTH